MIKLLESKLTETNNVVQNVDDGALMNFQAAAQRNGALYGWLLSLTSNTVRATSGVLMVRGYRLKAENNDLVYQLSGSYPLPASPVPMYLYARVIRTGDNATFSFQLFASQSQAVQENIERVSGTHDYLIATLTLTSSGLTNLVSNIATITASTGGGSTVVGLNVPTPQLENVFTEKMTALDGVLCLRNKSDYDALASTYTVQLVFYRYVQKARYRHQASPSKQFFYKTGFVRTASNIGLGSRHNNEPALFSVTVPLANLKTVILQTVGDYVHRRTDVIDLMSNYVDSVFYDQGAVYEDGRWMPNMENENLTQVTRFTNPFFIRTTRSKRVKVNEWLDQGSRSVYFNNNVFRFAFKAEITDNAGKKIAESGLSNVVEIRPNLRHKAIMGDTAIIYRNRGMLFTIKLL